jgi:hypothetical protein
VHYALLNYRFFRNTRQEIQYKNDANSYSKTSKMLTLLRLNGSIPWEAFDDVTKPVKEFRAFENVREFIRQEAENLLSGYWRDLQQSQPNHIEIVCEKNTIYHMALRIGEKYQIPVSSVRGFASIDAWYRLSQRYHDSGKDRLIVIILSDYDPEGEMIPQVCGRTLRDDFDIDDVEIIKAGVTRKQIEAYNLPAQNFAKEESKNKDWFLERNGGDEAVYELEALNPQAMLDDLDSVVRGVLDIELFNAEVRTQKEEDATLDEKRKELLDRLKGLAD